MQDSMLVLKMKISHIIGVREQFMKHVHSQVPSECKLHMGFSFWDFCHLLYLKKLNQLPDKPHQSTRFCNQIAGDKMGLQVRNTCNKQVKLAVEERVIFKK